MLAPEGYPKVGYYCPLHEYQKPKAGQPAAEEYQAHLKTCQSFQDVAALAGGKDKK